MTASVLRLAWLVFLGHGGDAAQSSSRLSSNVDPRDPVRARRIEASAGTRVANADAKVIHQRSGNRDGDLGRTLDGMGGSLGAILGFGALLDESVRGSLGGSLGDDDVEGIAGPLGHAGVGGGGTMAGPSINGSVGHKYNRAGTTVVGVVADATDDGNKIAINLNISKYAGANSGRGHGSVGTTGLRVDDGVTAAPSSLAGVAAEAPATKVMRLAVDGGSVSIGVVAHYGRARGGRRDRPSRQKGTGRGHRRGNRSVTAASIQRVGGGTHGTSGSGGNETAVGSSSSQVDLVGQRADTGDISRDCGVVAAVAAVLATAAAGASAGALAAVTAASSFAANAASGFAAVFSLFKGRRNGGAGGSGNGNPPKAAARGVLGRAWAIAAAGGFGADVIADEGDQGDYGEDTYSVRKEGNESDAEFGRRQAAAHASAEGMLWCGVAFILVTFVGFASSRVVLESVLHQ
eukprot:TRINITY_DN49326_c0_g1_i1.p1 TRINITY_DN49326_c0_g1~~TRINITY_DN49326_c0_g1_i1.p1  ORF type:complete len:462 (-),score=95.10 TRINITY_DN49326_c0_g1_i1:21-1406(-)